MEQHHATSIVQMSLSSLCQLGQGEIFDVGIWTFLKATDKITQPLCCCLTHRCWFGLTFTTCPFPAPIKSLSTSLPGERRLAPHAPSPGWHPLSLLIIIKSLGFGIWTFPKAFNKTTQPSCCCLTCRCWRHSRHRRGPQC